MKKFFLSVALVYTSFVFSQDVYYVLAGSNGTGSQSAPFGTIKEAIVAAGNSTAIIHIGSGIYELDETINLTNKNDLTFQALNPDAKPSIRGSRTVTGWVIHNATENIWKADIGSYYSRQLYVNDERVTRAKSETCMIDMTGTVYSSCGDIPEIGPDAEIVSNWRWRSTRLPVEDVCGRKFMIPQDLYNRAHLGGEHTRLDYDWIENSLSFIDQVNEWYIDRSGESNILYIKIAAGVLMNNPSTNPPRITLPVLEKLVESNGCSHITFKDLIFEYCTWNYPSEFNSLTNSNNGFINNQADAYFIGNDLDADITIPGNISFKNSSYISFTGCKFQHLGATALEFGQGCHDNLICTNEFTDISGSAIHIGDITEAPNPCLNPLLPIENQNCYYCNCANVQGRLVKNHDLNNNQINHVAKEYKGSVGIFVSFARYTNITSNTISNFPYTGISIGWQWDNRIDHGKNTISKNYIDCSDQELCDGGGIYILSSQGIDTGNPCPSSPPNCSTENWVYTGIYSTHSTVSENYILNQKFYQAAIYLDQGASYLTVDNNLIDIENTVNLSAYADGKPNIVCGFTAHLNSKDVTFKNNNYNSKYAAPNNCDTCTITYQNNQTFTGYKLTDPIKSNAGHNPSNTCN